MTFPNVIIAGAPRSGTSSVFRWLSDHPEVCGSNIKETFYLMDIDSPLRNLKFNFLDDGLPGYQKFFENCSQTNKVILEATTHYIYQHTPIEVLSKFKPLPHIIFVLRKPSARIYSSYQYTKNNRAKFTKDIPFHQIIDKVLNNKGKELFDFCEAKSAYVLINDIKYSQYIDYISRWLSEFDRDHIHIFLLENIKENPYRVFSDLSRRIDIDPQFYKSYQFERQNETLYLKNKWIHKQARKVARIIKSDRIKIFLKKKYLNSQSSYDIREISEEDRKTLKILDNYFMPFNEKLSQKLDIDVSAWL